MNKQGGTAQPARNLAGFCRRSRSLLCGAALATAWATAPAHATAFQGSGAVLGGSGNATITQGTDTDTINVGTSKVVIDWTPSDTATGGGAIDFLPTGKTGLFQSGLGNFTVLNRINAADPTRAIQFDGHVISQITAGNGAATRGGNIWFYAPGGIILGAGSVFDVGSLLLTADAITLGQGNTLPDPADGISFRGTAGSLSQIEIQAGAQVNADVLAGSYVALVAPRIRQAGGVNVNGTAAYVAAEGVDITVHNGLFDIGVTTGTSATGTTGGTAALVHGGTTTGPAAGGAAGGNQATYLIAVPKNGVITMLVGGSLGYQAAASASVQNGVVVLAGNRNVTTAASAAGTPTVSLSASGASGTANADLGGATVTTALLGAADGISVASGAKLTTGGDVTLAASRAIDIADLDMEKAGGLNLRSDGLLNLTSMSGKRPGAITLSGEYLTTGDLRAAGGIDLAAASGNLDLSGGRVGITTGELTSDTGDIALASSANIRAGNLTATTGDISTRSGNTITSTSGNSSIIAGGDVSIVDGTDKSASGGRAFGAIEIYNITAGGTVALREIGGYISLHDLVAGGDAQISTHQNFDAATVSAHALRQLDAAGKLQPVGTFTVPGRFDVDTLDLATGDLAITAGTDLYIDVANLPESRRIDLHALGGEVNFFGYSADAKPSSVTIAAAEDIETSDLEAAGDIDLTSTTNQIATGSLTSDAGNITLSALSIGAANLTATGGNITTTSRNELQLANGTADKHPLGNVVAGGDITIVDGHDVNPNNIGGNIHINELHAGGTATLTEAGGPIEIEGVMSAGTAITASSLGSLTVNGASVGADDGTLTLTVAALRGKPGNLDISGGTNSAAHVVLNSGDIQIKSGALVGGSGARSIGFNNSGGVQTVIGDGSGSVKGAAVYQLDGAELARVEAAGITINAPIVAGGSGNPDVIIGGFTLASGNGLPSSTQQNLVGTSGSLTIATPGTMLVNGAVALEYLGSGNGLMLNAGQRLDGLLPDASVALTDGSGDLAGTLTMTAPTITFASQSAMGDIGSAASLADISARLGTNDASENDAGYLRAQTINADIDDALFAQNSGANSDSANDRAGITVGSGGLNLAGNGGGGERRLVVNGRQETPGGEVTGLTFIDAIRFGTSDAPVTPAAGSSVNGCSTDGAVCPEGTTSGTAFQGSYTVTSGSASVDRGADTDTITLGSSGAVIDWKPYDVAIGGGAITFLPTGKTGIFQSTIGGFTVLNRIEATDPTRAIRFDGHVVSQIVDAGGAASGRGGNVWFYAPGGILLGAGSVFDVGSLLLTANAITLGADNTLPDIATGIGFAGDRASTAGIMIADGAHINADAVDGSYVALVASRIDQAGTVSVDGSAGYLALTRADLSISNGTFAFATTTNADGSIAANVTGSQVGTSGDTILTHSGTTGGPASSGSNPHNIYMVALSQNAPVTMQVGGTIGFQPASGSTPNGAIVLDADAVPTNMMAGVNGGNLSTNGAGGAIAVANGTFSSDAALTANGTIDIAAITGDFSARGISTYGSAQTSFAAGDGHTLDIAGDAKVMDVAVALDADGGGIAFGGGLGLDVTGSGRLVASNGGTIGVSGALTGTLSDLTISGTAPAGASSPVTAGSIDLTAADITIDTLATGGDATLTATGSFGAQALTIGGSLHAGGTDIAIGTATAGRDLSLAAGNGVNLTGDVGASGTSTITTGALAIGGALTGGDVTLTSSDIAIGSDASVSGSHVTFANNGGRRMFVGDGTAAPGSGAYLLDSSEIARVHTAGLSIEAPAVTASTGDSPNGADLVLGSLTLTGADGSAGTSSPNITGSDSLVSFHSGGDLQLAGKLDFTSFGSGTNVRLSANAITGVLPNAGIALTNAGGDLSGNLTLSANTITFASQSVADQLASAMTLADKDGALGSNDSVQNSDGYIRANTIAFAVGAGLYTQNSGTSSDTADRAGVAAGAGGITLSRFDGQSQAPIEVVLNGSQQNAAGTLAGNGLVSHISYDGTSFTPAARSTVNGCFFDSSNCTPSEPQMAPAQIIPPVQDVIASVIETTSSPSSGGSGGSRSSASKVTQLASTGNLAAPAGTPLIDVSLVGADNVDLWGANHGHNAVYDGGK